MTGINMEQYIAKPQVLEELVYHDISKMQAAVGPLWKFVDASIMPETDVTLLVRKLERAAAPDSQIGPEPHTHQANQLYCFLGDLKVEVTMEEQKKMVEAPVAVLIPAGTRHAIRFAGGTGYVVNILSQKNYQ